jgi:tetratricopeptide (TPR) repeat protein
MAAMARRSTIRAVVVAAVAASSAIAACRGTDASEPTSGSREARLAQARQFAEQRRFRAAQAELDALLAASPKDVEALDAKAGVERALGLERQALATLLELRVAAPDEPRFAYEAGELAARVGDPKRAKEQFADAHRLAPDDWRPDVARAALLLKEAPPKLDEAEALLARWLEGPGARVEARFHHALVVQERAKRGGADGGATRDREPLAAFEWALELDPRHLPSLCAAALLVEERGDRERALELLRRAKNAADPGDVALEQELDRRIARLTTTATKRP